MAQPVPMTVTMTAAGFYPTLGRATGGSWMTGVGRIGGIFGAMGGGLPLSLGWPFESIFRVLSLPAFATAAILLCSVSVCARRRGAPPAEQASLMRLDP